jgi:hypothetical protein
MRQRLLDVKNLVVQSHFHKFNVKSQDMGGLDGFLLACHSNKYNVVDHLLTKYRFNVKHKTERHEHCVYMAAMNPDSDVMDLLINKYNVNINSAFFSHTLFEQKRFKKLPLYKHLVTLII